MENKDGDTGSAGGGLLKRKKSVSRLHWQKMHEIGKFGSKVENVYKSLDRSEHGAGIADEGVEQFVGGDSVEVWPASAAWFLGPKAENIGLLKELVNYGLDQHAEFRKYKYFPLDPNYITANLKKSESFVQATEKLKDELGGLISRLKNSVPFFNFRSQGHMLWDTTLASNVGYIAALLYNQNNVASMASGVTLQLEREVAKDLCKMVGYTVYNDENEHTTENPGSWGHLPNGGTAANLEAMWAARSLKFNGLALQKMMKTRFKAEGLETIEDNFKYRNLAGDILLLRDAGAWDLLNIPVDTAIDLFDSIRHCIDNSALDKKVSFEELFSWVKEFTLEELGGWEFYQTFKTELSQDSVSCAGKWFVPGSRHYSWDKGANILGIGRNNLVKVPLDKSCRMDMTELEKMLEQCLENRIPVIGVTVVFGTTQEGAVDNLDQVLLLRKSFEKRGLTFYIHIDGAWGGYFATILRTPEPSKGGVLKAITTRNKRVTVQFLQANISKHFTKQLSVMHKANSITLDPHKSGFCPYPAGGLLYRNGNIRKFLAQKAAYVNHGTGNNEEINLFGIDGSKPGAASAGVWLSHKVIGLHNMGYGLLLEQCTFSAGIMYSLWVSLERSVDPFLVVPAIPVLKEFNGWSKPKIRREILEAENWRLQMNTEAMKFINENGPDTLINCLSLNVRKWNAELSAWENNTDCDLQRRFVKNFYKRCSHSFERPNMVDRGIQIILNATSWGKESHSGAYQEMKNSLGLEAQCDESIAVIINTCMSPWLRAQKTFQRIGVILRNELYNAYGAIFDEPEELFFVSPCYMFEKDWNGEVFAELEASFSNPSLRYHAIGMFKFPKSSLEKLRDLATKAHEQEIFSGNSKPMRIKTRSKMTVFEFMTGGDTECVNQPRTLDSEAGKSDILKKPLNEKLEEYSEDGLEYDDIGMPEVGVTVYFDEVTPVETKLKMKRIIRYHHLTRDNVDEKDYPPSQEYFLYSDKQNAYLSHCPNRWPDFQQQIQLDEIPRLSEDPEQQLTESDCLYQEALRRGVVVYLPQIQNGGRPLLSNKSANTCRDPLKQHLYNAVSWSDQGAFTGDMHSITLKFYCQWSKRWFNGQNINKGYNRESEPHMYNQAGERRDAKDLESDDEQED